MPEHTLSTTQPHDQARCSMKRVVVALALWPSRCTSYHRVCYNPNLCVCASSSVAQPEVRYRTVSPRRRVPPRVRPRTPRGTWCLDISAARCWDQDGYGAFRVFQRFQAALGAGVVRVSGASAKNSSRALGCPLWRDTHATPPQSRRPRASRPLGEVERGQLLQAPGTSGGEAHANASAADLASPSGVGRVSACRKTAVQTSPAPIVDDAQLWQGATRRTRGEAPPTARDAWGVAGSRLTSGTDSFHERCAGEAAPGAAHR